MCIFMFTFKDGEEEQLIVDGTSITVRGFFSYFPEFREAIQYENLSKLLK